MTGGAKEGVARRARASRRGAIVESLLSTGYEAAGGRKEG